MPTNLVKQLVVHVQEIDRKLEQHLDEGKVVLTNIATIQTTIDWLKWFVIGISGGIGAIVVGLLIYSLKR